MFQNFKENSDPAQGRDNITQLRTELSNLGLTGWVMSRADEFGGENLAPYAERLAWLTGFTGSAGSIVVLSNKAAIFVDGRYTLQVRDQVDSNWIEPISILETTPADWLKEQLEPDDVIGFDPWLYTSSQVDSLKAACNQSGATLKACQTNPVDTVWTGQPARPQNPIVPHPIEFAGRSSQEKLADISKSFAKKAEATFITQGDSIAWLFNIRGSDVPRAPLPLAFAIVTATGTSHLITDPAKLTDEARAHLPATVTVRALDDLADLIGELAKTCGRWMLDDNLVPLAVKQMIEATGATIVEAADPCLRPKARKNAAELDGMRAAHKRDGVAMCRYLHWLDEAATVSDLDEITAVKALEEFRIATGVLKDISFESIAGAGPNGALCHYRVTESSNRRFDQNSLFLIDSGGQYIDGTTDITRTIAIGTPDAEMKDRFTRVLKGMIALTLMHFPKGTPGIQLDTVARLPLWQAGLDYAHGTGHGVGSYLCVHEGPQSISKRGKVALETGNILSNEPGYYKEGAWGIRIENLVIVTEPEIIGTGDQAMHGFETLTLCPIDRRLIDTSLLTDTERNWLNDYHELVFAELSPELDEDPRAWLAAATRPIQ